MAIQTKDQAQDKASRKLDKALHKKTKRNPWVAFKSFALAQCGKNAGGVKRSRQSQTQPTSLFL